MDDGFVQLDDDDVDDDVGENFQSLSNWNFGRSSTN